MKDQIMYSYVSKEDFVKLIQDLPFNYVNYGSLGLITGFILDEERKDKTRPVGYSFKIGDYYDYD